MANFTTRPVVGGGVYVSGIDDAGTNGQTVLFDSAWEAYLEHVKFTAAVADYDAEVRAFFAPLVAAAEALKPEEKKDWTHIVLSEGSEGTESEVVHLGREGVILRILAETDGSSLRWVDNVLIALEV